MLDLAKLPVDAQAILTVGLGGEDEHGDALGHVLPRPSVNDGARRGDMAADYREPRAQVAELRVTRRVSTLALTRGVRGGTFSAIALATVIILALLPIPLGLVGKLFLIGGPGLPFS